MPIRLVLKLFLFTGLIAPLCAFALGIGQLTVRSTLNQYFEGDIPLIVNHPSELVGLVVRLPQQSMFTQLGVERQEFMSSLRFAVHTPSQGTPLIRITSVQPIREPNFDLLIEVMWSRGRLLRTFSVHLNPELYANRHPLPPPREEEASPPSPPFTEETTSTAARPSTAAPRTPPLPVSLEGATEYGPVKPGERLTRIAEKVRPSPAISVADMMAILVSSNPQAFTRGNPNTLRVGAVLKVPSAQALGMAGTSPSTPGVQAEVIPPHVESPPPSALAEVKTTPPADVKSSVVEAPPSPAEEPPAPPLPPPVAEVAPPTPAASHPPATAPSVEGTASVGIAPPARAPTGIETPPKEIVPAATLPHEASSPTVAPAQTPSSSPVGEEVKPPVVAEATSPTPPVPPVAAEAVPPTPPPPLAPKPPLPEEAGTGMEWWENPAVWVGLVLIVLAVGALLMLPMLRRPARKKSAAETAAEETLPVSPTAEGESVSPPPVAAERMQSVGRRPEAASKLRTSLGGEEAAAPPAVAEPVAQPTPPTLVKPTGSAGPTIAKPAAKTAPKPIDELLKGIDFNLSDGRMQTAKGGTPLEPSSHSGPLPRLPDAEPPTSSVTRIPGPDPLAAPLAKTPSAPSSKAASAAPDVSGKPIPPLEPPSELPALEFGKQPLPNKGLELSKPVSKPEPRVESPTELLGKINFDIDGLGLGTAPKVADELPPLELKPKATPLSSEPLKPKAATPPPSGPLTSSEPLTDLLAGMDWEFPSRSSAPLPPQTPLSPASGEKSIRPKPEDFKFEFTDITKELPHEELAPLDFDDSTINLGKIETSSTSPELGRNEASDSDYVETKLDLAAAYLDMGDQVGARGLLEEVLREGSENQKQRAQTLLKKLG